MLRRCSAAERVGVEATGVAVMGMRNNLLRKGKGRKLLLFPWLHYPEGAGCQAPTASPIARLRLRLIQLPRPDRTQARQPQREHRDITPYRRRRSLTKAGTSRQVAVRLVPMVPRSRKGRVKTPLYRSKDRHVKSRPIIRVPKDLTNNNPEATNPRAMKTQRYRSSTSTTS
jgi:hypothetical protein